MGRPRREDSEIVLAGMEEDHRLLLAAIADLEGDDPMSLSDTRAALEQIYVMATGAETYFSRIHVLAQAAKAAADDPAGSEIADALWAVVDAVLDPEEDDLPASEGYAPGMRQSHPGVCWRLLSNGGWCCILPRGHDHGKHEPTPAPLGVVNVAWCPEHGLHGQRTQCHVCGGPVEQVPMVSVSAVDGPSVTGLLSEVERYIGVDGADSGGHLEYVRDRLRELAGIDEATG